jgi:hypothetical protein
MAREESGGRGAVFYWIGWAILLVAVVAIAWTVFRSPAELGI